MTIAGVLNLLVFLVIGGLICWLILWFVDYVGVVEPFRKVIKVVVMFVAVLILINALLGLVGAPLVRW